MSSQGAQTRSHKLESFLLNWTHCTLLFLMIDHCVVMAGTHLDFLTLTHRHQWDAEAFGLVRVDPELDLGFSTPLCSRTKRHDQRTWPGVDKLSVSASAASRSVQFLTGC